MALSINPDSFSPITQGDTLIPLSAQFAQYIDGMLTAFDLTGATITIEFQLANDVAITHNGTGTWLIDNAPGGLAHYTYSSADVATAGLWTLWIKVTKAGVFAHTLTKTLEILEAPA